MTNLHLWLFVRQAQRQSATVVVIDPAETRTAACASTHPSTIRTLVGMEHRANGVMIVRTIACLPAIVGAW